MLALEQALVLMRTLNTKSARGINLTTMRASLFAVMWVYTKIAVAFAADIVFRKIVSGRHAPRQELFAAAQHDAGQAEQASDECVGARLGNDRQVDIIEAGKRRFAWIYGCPDFNP